MPRELEPFAAYAEELLSGVGPVRARAMFGGYGLYLGGVMFALVDGDELFLKADDVTRATFVEAGCRRWSYEANGRSVEMPYYRPPDDAHEHPEAMLPWARLALEAARRGKAEKERRKAAGSRTSPGIAKPRARGRAARTGGAPSGTRRSRSR